ncbi:5-(carboxyamino)imidazole ribonucleotide mutase [Brackiella oedipodis]|uniref:5-(carboxyamino)imidazole ribonucleotide mutase n=1 Tax=Brackiella oedipodis TaxID=124225 RepID=UPI00048F2239|nr:5-(carboxyamino)imidazole ribonucleotide mutase [Brackiella oedipodis]
MSASMPAKVAVLMGSESDWPIMSKACEILDEFVVPYEAEVISAHRMPLQMVEFGAQAWDRGFRAVIAGAGGAAHLPGMLAALTEIPVFGVPVPSKHLQGEDSLLSIVQMPKGVPVATFAIGIAGAANAALHAIANLAMHDEGLRQKLINFRQRQTAKAQAMRLPPLKEPQ